jgi:predicted hotdog family 3-hydroxylacyl-ACP dehydratase
MMNNSNEQQMLPPIEELLSHTGDMLLLDRVLAFDNESTIAECSPKDHAWYSDSMGDMPAWMGIELMAQTVATHVGLLKRSQHAPPKHGMLLGTRSYRASVPCFSAHAPLQIQATIVYRDDSGLGAYDCIIKSGENILANATLKVFEPDNFESFLRGSPT